ncbi:MAG TPA: CDP-alcohol phosphatidyltransferase family protein [Polyangia bacterium]|jgi:cardiolipin synthase
MTIPNVLTIARLIMIPIFGFLWARGEVDKAFWIFVIAALTDILDGFIARTFNQYSRLGAILDPAADKLLLFVSFIVAAMTRAVPVWLSVLVIGRDVLVGIGASIFAWILKGRYDPEEWHPSRIGKTTMFLQSLVVGGALLEAVFHIAFLRTWLPALMLMAATMTAASLIQYIAIAVQALRRPSRPAAPGESPGAGDWE